MEKILLKEKNINTKVLNNKIEPSEMKAQFNLSLAFGLTYLIFNSKIINSYGFSTNQATYAIVAKQR
jgi:hypothetical protein